MQKHLFNSSMRPAALLMASLLLSSQAFAQCCPSGGGAPATSGLGQATPLVTDLAADPDWQVHEFRSGGIRYIVINDASGKVRAGVGRVGSAFWDMHIGSDAGRVMLESVSIASRQRKVLYRTSDVEVILHRTASGDYWEVHQPKASD